MKECFKKQKRSCRKWSKHKTLCLKRHEVSEKIGLGCLAHFMVDMKQGKLKFKKNFKIRKHLTKLLTI